MDDEIIEVEYVEAEIVDYIPPPGVPLIPEVSAENLPKDAVAAPPPERLFFKGYFQKGGIPGPGRKRKYASPEQMQADIEKYFTELLVATRNPETGQTTYSWSRPPTVPGLARALGMTDRALRNYAHRDEFDEVVESAMDVIREYLETGVCQPGNQSGRIFLMKNLGYSDTKTYTFAPPSRLDAAKTPEEIAQLVSEDIVD